MSPLAPGRVHGVLVLDAEVAGFTGATLHVYLEDVSRIDAPATIVARASIPNLHHRAGEVSRFDFELRGGPVDPAAHYSLRAHVDLDGSGTPAPGDLVTVQSFPVLTFGHPDRVTLSVRQIE